MAVEKLFRALSTKYFDLFHNAVFDVCSSAICALDLRAPDRKQRFVGFLYFEFSRVFGKK